MQFNFMENCLHTTIINEYNVSTEHGDVNEHQSVIVCPETSFVFLLLLTFVGEIDLNVRSSSYTDDKYCFSQQNVRTMVVMMMMTPKCRQPRFFHFSVAHWAVYNTLAPMGKIATRDALWINRRCVRVLYIFTVFSHQTEKNEWRQSENGTAANWRETKRISIVWIFCCLCLPDWMLLCENQYFYVTDFNLSTVCNLYCVDD